jgi:hypothetical protein
MERKSTLAVRRERRLGRFTRIFFRFITDTCIKNDQNILATFKTIAISSPQIG